MVLNNQTSVVFTPNAHFSLDTEKVNVYLSHLVGNLMDNNVFPKEDLEKAMTEKLKKDVSPFCSVSLEEVINLEGVPIGTHLVVDYSLDPPSRLYH